jgi:sulfotransferase family protein
MSSAVRRRAARTRNWTRRLLARSGPPRVPSRPQPAGVDGGIDLPPPPPPCPAGWRTGPPDFVGVGVQRCGSSRWFRLIAAHPDVVEVRAAKELHYFDRYYAGGFTAADAAGYHVYFPRSGAGQMTGEWTPLYISAPWIPRLLAAAAPEARLLVLLRDPVERFRSALELNARVARKRGAPLSRYAPLEAFARGYYHAQLTALLRYFERSQVLVLQYERCTREPAPELARTLRFLGLSDIEFAPDLEEHPQRLAEKQPLDPDARAAYVGAYSDDVARLIEDFPEIDVGLWPNFAHLAERPKVA